MCFGVKYRHIVLRVVLYFDEPAGRVKIQTRSLSTSLVGNFKENYKCNRMSARTVLYNKQLYNIVEYLYSFRALSVQ